MFHSCSALKAFGRCLKNCDQNLSCRSVSKHFKHKYNFAASCAVGYRQMYKYPERSTIYAVSYPAVVALRISGPDASKVLLKVAKLKKLPEERKAVLCRLKDPETDELLDKALALWFPSPKSYTGEDMCELHIHGSRPVVGGILRALQKLPHFQPAEPGEFTKRAFMAGKLDLTEVEGLADLLSAETEVQRRQALGQMNGGLHKLYTDWTDRLKRCSAKLEAFIDFGEDQHLDESILPSVQKDLEALRNEISHHLGDHRRGEKVRSGVCAVIAGRPNVGKSTLMNYLCQKEVAIVSPAAGTTRDILEFSLNIGGYMVNFCDTAGVREPSDVIEQEGVKRAKDKSFESDLLLFILEASRALELISSNHNHNINELVAHLLSNELGQSYLKSRMRHRPREDSVNALVLLNKIDLLPKEKLAKVKQLDRQYPSICAISCTDGTGMEEFLQVLSGKIKKLCCGHAGELPAITRERHRESVSNCLRALVEFDICVAMDVALAADKLRHARSELGKVTGKIRVNDILDIIFKDFCIGK